MIAVDGHGGSGKSTLADWLGKKLNASVLHIDDFSGADNPQWWPRFIEQVIEPIKKGAKKLSYARASWWENHPPEPVVDQPVTEIMVLEGVGSLRKEMRAYISLALFVDTPKEICLQRGIERDRSTGKSDAALEKIWEDWFQKEEEYMQQENPKTHADSVLDGTKPFEDQIDL